MSSDSKIEWASRGDAGDGPSVGEGRDDGSGRVTSWTDKAGHRLVVAPADGLNPARLEVALPDGEKYGFAARFWLDGEAGLAEIAVAMFAASGQPAPVITPRPDVDTRAGMDFGPLRLKVAERGRVAVQAGAVAETWPSSRVRQVAGAMVAYADAAESEPDPAEVEKLGNLIAEERSLAGSAELARKILRAGYQREAGNA